MATIFGMPNSQDEDLKKKLGLLLGVPDQTAPVQESAVTPPVQPTAQIAPPASPSLPPVTVPQTPQNPQLAKDQTELTRLKTTGSGISQIHNPILKTLARIGDIAGTAFFPGVTANIPGTEIHHRQLINQQVGNIAEDEAQAAKAAGLEQEQAQTYNLKHPQVLPKTPIEQAFASALTQINPETNKPYTPTEAFAHVQQISQDVKPDAAGRTITTDKGIQQWNPKTNRYDIPAGNVPVKDQKSDSLDQQYNDAIQRGDHAEAKRILQVKHDLATAGQAPQRDPQIPLVIPDGKGGYQIIAAHPGMHIEAGAQTPGQFGGEADKFDKAYVQPANAVEKSYQMMNNAYNEYKQAAAQGKQLPTGAQSMLALSTHLATTFGNVKGARVTKDMIEHHLGARGIGDSAVVAVQRLTNGDVLSPDQWEAFHQLIGESRKLSWQTAATEAKRKGLPEDFMPQDLKGGAPQGGANYKFPDGSIRAVSPDKVARAKALGAIPQ